jgi:hypothetical protein
LCYIFGDCVLNAFPQAIERLVLAHTGDGGIATRDLPGNDAARILALDHFVIRPYRE